MSFSKIVVRTSHSPTSGNMALRSRAVHSEGFQCGGSSKLSLTLQIVDRAARPSVVVMTQVQLEVELLADGELV